MSIHQFWAEKREKEKLKAPSIPATIAEKMRSPRIDPNVKFAQKRRQRNAEAVTWVLAPPVLPPLFMGTETSSGDQYIPAPSPEEPVFMSSGVGMFTGSQHFTIAGGMFNNIIKNYRVVPTVPPDFRRIPMGDIDLEQELVVNKKTGVVGRRPERKCVRRVYSAKIDGRKSNVTVAVYQGDGAKEGNIPHFVIWNMEWAEGGIIPFCGRPKKGILRGNRSFLAQWQTIS
ncbi:hypothetical protein B0H16DRAFT_1763296 [Mycena metata]|uniref:Uncharacterized protein n=1 Tax=Mycena metata TaxID=1033252 RepID=A0AAD7K1K3_9AGAR|nr:hypothetical protein B0H16DRAFT_1763296 [Mycena metata]